MRNKEIEKLFNINIIHGRYLVNVLNTEFKEKLGSLEINIDKNIYICTVLDEGTVGMCTLDPIKIKNNKVNKLTVKVYEKWISKIETLYNFITENYDDLPEYILYLDGHDTLILKDITDINKLLDFYQCKILFNYEPYYRGTGYQSPHKTYLLEYEKLMGDYAKKNEEKYGIYHEFGLNAGVFVGEKEFVCKMLEEALSYMKSDINKNFPYGCTDDQYVLRYLHNKYYSIISIDFFSKLTFWGCSYSLEHPIGDEHFEIGHSNRLLSEEEYLKNNKK